MALTKIFTGMENGPEKIDDNFSNLETEINLQEIKVNEWSSSGITLLNGAQYYSDADHVFYRTIQLTGQYQLVQLSGTLSNISLNTKGKAVLSIPKNLTAGFANTDGALRYAMPTTGSYFVRWEWGINGQLIFTTTNGSPSGTDKWWFPIDCMWLNKIA